MNGEIQGSNDRLSGITSEFDTAEIDLAQIQDKLKGTKNPITKFFGHMRERGLRNRLGRLYAEGEDEDYIMMHKPNSAE